MPIKLSCSAILFDLDGVLAYSAGSVERQWTAWAIQYGLDPARVIAVAHGRPTIQTVREFAAEIGSGVDLETEALDLERREMEDTSSVHPIGGAADLVTRIPVDRWTVVTSGTRALAESRLRYVGLPIPPTMITASDIERGKPDPEPYLKGAAALSFPAKECVVVEDAPAGIQSAHAAGMRVIGVATTYAADEIADADYVVKRLSDLRVTTTNTSGRQNVRLEILIPTGPP